MFTSERSTNCHPSFCLVPVEDLLQQITDLRNLPPSIHTTLWPQLFELIPSKLRKILNQTYPETPITSTITNYGNPSHQETIQEYLARIVKQFESKFRMSPPYTILRLCEIMRNPRELYSTPVKFLHAVEVILGVSSTIQDFEMAPEKPKSHNSNTANETTNEDITIADATQASIMDITIEDASQANISTEENQDSGQIYMNEEGGLYLRKIDWLTPENIEEVQRMDYLLFEDVSSELQSNQTTEEEENIPEGEEEAEEELPLENVQHEGEVLEHEEEYTEV